jgi:hypothetical protein
VDLFDSAEESRAEKGAVMIGDKKETDEELTHKIEHARHHGKDREETAMEALMTPVRQGLPTSWHSADGKTHLKGADAQVRVANGQEVANYGFAPTRVCGTCKYFDVNNGRKEMHKQKFLHRLVRDETWKTKFLGVPVDHVGLCGASDGSKAVTSISHAGRCDQYRENPSFARRRNGGG